MSPTPRRTLHVPDDAWNAGHANAQSDGGNLCRG